MADVYQARAKKRRKAERETAIPVNSFADIAFLLIIFFVIATKLMQNLGVMTEFPAGEKSEAPSDKSISIILFRDKILLNDDSVDVAGLRQRLLAKKLSEKRDDKERIVLLEARGDVPYQTYFDVMSTISAAGGMIAIVTEEEDKGSG